MSFAVVNVYVKHSSTPLAEPVPCTGTRKEKSWGLESCSEIMSRASVPEGSSVDAQAFSVFFLRSVVQPSFLLRVVYKAALVARAANRRRDDVREMPYLPRDAHVDPPGVSVLSNTASLHSTAIVEFVAARMRACSS